MSVDPSIPRFVNLRELRSNPLAFLQAAHIEGGGLIVISENGPLFSRAQNCSAAVAVFGTAGVRQVLNDTDVFGTAVSVGELFSLPPTLKRLNAGLFNMHGEQHSNHQQLLTSFLTADGIVGLSDAIVQGWESFNLELEVVQEVPLLSEMRRLALHVSERMIFGDANLELGRLIQSYFYQRRSLSGRQLRPGPAARRELIRLGFELDRALCAKLAALRKEASASPLKSKCLLTQLSTLGNNVGVHLTDDELIAHANTLFMSSSEPVAVALTWTLILLSQKPELRCAIRTELTRACRADSLPPRFNEIDLPLLKAVIQESLRLLPPNAVMVRLTTRPGRLLEHELPQNCEVVLSPYVAHRDPHEFVDPATFNPHRWSNLRPSTYAYFPFGIGTRYCVGKQLAKLLLVSMLARILDRYDVILARDQELDWTIDVTMMPASDPVVRFIPKTRTRECMTAGRLGGPVAALVRF